MCMFDCVAQDRDRVYAICGNFELLGLSYAETRQLCVKIHEQAAHLKVDCGELSPMLLSNTAPQVQAALASFSARPKQDDSSTGAAWMQKHGDFCKTKGLTLSTLKVQPKFTKSDWFRTLSPREQDALNIHITLNPKIRYIDLNPSIDRMSSSEADGLFTIVPGATIYDVCQNRRLVGTELMHLKGFDYALLEGAIESDAAFSDHFFRDLAGNAFTVSIANAILIGVLACMDPSNLNLFLQSKKVHKVASQCSDEDVSALLRF
jgi:hypothetical protein